ncbi:hypothetical protein [Fodinicola acaciae]|uniref:hypothetical protein n=1 Tax=Fodinicola acaciae TaxID=2681555 RepID=UPI0013D70BD7|nr:hypothetical protein [Fodinicola acaciae]
MAMTTMPKFLVSVGPVAQRHLHARFGSPVARWRWQVAEWIRGRPDVLVDGHGFLRRRWCELLAVHVEQNELLASIRDGGDRSTTATDQLHAMMQRERAIYLAVARHYAAYGEDLAAHACQSWASYLLQLDTATFIASYGKNNLDDDASLVDGCRD